MKYLILIFLFLSGTAFGQPPINNPKNTEFSKTGTTETNAKKDIYTVPPQVPVRTLAEWEELEAIALTYDIEYSEPEKKLIVDIAYHAKEEVNVIIFCEGISSFLIDVVKDELKRKGLSDFNNIHFIERNFDGRIWIRDFGAHTVYENEVGNRLLIDWLYDPGFSNADFLISGATSEYLGSDLHMTSKDEYKLKLDGGNLQSDGLGTAITSTHIFDDNPGYSEESINWISKQFMGIENFIKLPKLPYDVIHHVDMHLKLIDEETILVGQYPDSISDGPQIEENLTYLLENHKTSFGTEFKIERIEMPADKSGNFPDTNNGCSDLGKGCYYTYTNAFFINELVLVPTYFKGQGADVEALRKWGELMPGYKIVGIDCSEIIKGYGAIHCATKEIGVKKPLRIIHKKVTEICENNDSIKFEAVIQHTSGIESASVYYKTGTNNSFVQTPMSPVAFGEWEAKIPNFPKGTTLTYFIRANARDGKTIARPMPAEKGGWRFEVGCESSSIASSETGMDIELFPNPFSEFINIKSPDSIGPNSRVTIHNSIGKLCFNGKIHSPYSIQTKDWDRGIYFLTFENKGKIFSKKLIKL